jgi:DNA-binding CsgD family transcriptional regulator
MVMIGLAFAMVERGNRQWWLMPAFGMVMPVITLLAVQVAHRIWRPAGAPAMVLTAPTIRADSPAGTAVPGPADLSEGVEASPAAPHPPARGARVVSEPLSARELQVLEQLASGCSNKEIAEALFVAPGTVKAHLHHIFRKLGAGSRLQAVAFAREAGLLSQPPGAVPSKPR